MIRWRKLLMLTFAGIILAMGAVLGTLTLLPDAQLAAANATASTLPLIGPGYSDAHAWYEKTVRPVDELRPLASFPGQWEGSWADVDRNYAKVERWFGDHLALRNLLIRAKNELDYRLFLSSSRVYFGRDGELYGRKIADIELPAAEAAMAEPAQRAAIVKALTGMARRLQADGITLVLIAPISKQYFTRERMPYFIPRVPDKSNFMAFYSDLRQVPELHLIDVVGIMQAQHDQLPLYYRQDFHWTDVTAMKVAQATVERIAALEGSPVRWQHPLEIEYHPFVGVESRFAARLTEPAVQEPQPKKTWTDRHQTFPLPPHSGYEFETDKLDAPDLLPPTCMYGNSFSDGMLRAGLTDHFQKFTKIDRLLQLSPVPALVHGRCKYLIMQVLDIQADRWIQLIQ